MASAASICCLSGGLKTPFNSPNLSFNQLNCLLNERRRKKEMALVTFSRISGTFWCCLRWLHSVGFAVLLGVWVCFGVCFSGFAAVGPTSSSSSVPPGETRVRTRCQRGGVCLESGIQPIGVGPPPPRRTRRHLFTTDPAR